MFFRQVDLTTALRPILLPDESLLLVQDGVGLYEGKYKIPAHQLGHAYLTSHRACYIDDDDPRHNSVALDLRDVDRAEFQAGFLRSSPKVTLFPKPIRRGFESLRISAYDPAGPSSPRLSSSSSPVSRTSSPFRPNISAPTPRISHGTWICPICSFSNPVPVGFDAGNASPMFPIPPCLACGIKPSFTHVLKAAISAASSNRGVVAAQQRPVLIEPGAAELGDYEIYDDTPVMPAVTCPRCTVHNHPSLLACEVCGASLVAGDTLRLPEHTSGPIRPESPGPLLETSSVDDVPEPESVKFSFRMGGERIFHERLKGALTQRKWLVRNAPPIPQPQQSQELSGASRAPGLSQEPPIRKNSPAVGIAGLEQRGIQSRKNNELVIGNAFEDLEALMVSAKDIVALAERFATESGNTSGNGSLQDTAILNESAAALGMMTTRDVLSSGAESLYISELSRNLAEYITDDRASILRREGGIMSLVDLWAVFNRNRNGVELISPTDFEKAARLWEKLNLPVRLRRFKSGVLAVQQSDWNDDKVIARLREWLHELRNQPGGDLDTRDGFGFGQGVTAQEAAQRFGWSIGVATEELEMAEDRGIVCREDGIERLKFWENHFITDDEDVS